MRIGIVITWFTFPTTKKHNLSLNMVYAENERCIGLVRIFADTFLTLKPTSPMGYNWAIEIMKKKALLIIAAISFVVVTIMTSCTAADVAGFQSGFRDGWNATAPAEYRY